MRIVIVPSTLALLPQYASTDDPVVDLRSAVTDAVAWLVEDGPVATIAVTPSGQKVADQLVTPGGDLVPGMLLVANGSATRTEKAPGHLDQRAEGFDAAIGTALAAGDLAALAAIDLDLAAELWAPDALALVSLGRRLAGQGVQVTDVKIDYDAAPYGVQYWVVRWTCESS